MLNVNNLIGFGSGGDNVPWSFIAAGTITTGSTGSLPSYNTGDLLVMVCISGTTIGTPSGWTLATSGDGNPKSNVFYKIAASESNPTGIAGTSVILSYRGINSSPLDVKNAGFNAGLTTTSVTTTANNCLVLSIFGTSKSAASWGTDPAATISRAKQDPTAAIFGLLIVDENQELAGATTTRTASITGPTVTNYAIAFKPA